MKSIKPILALSLAMVLIFMLIPMPIVAAQENTPKEEVVYVNLNHDGSVKEIYVVNIFELDSDGMIVDYGRYESLRNMTSTVEIGYSDPVVTIDAKAGKLYYEGKLKSNVIPWNISIHYYMDGIEYGAEEIVGKSGNLKITMSITENEECTGNFFEGYALQASLTLNTQKCKNIIADKATVANVGRNKQLTYTILPNKGADIEITATVSDFELNSISLNGVKLKLNIEIDDTDIQETIDKMIGAVKNLDDGADKLNNGADELYGGTTTLKDKMGQLYAGVGELTNGSVSLADGLSQIASQNEQLLNGAWEIFVGLCNVSTSILNAQLNQNGLASVTLTPENYTAVLNDLLKTLNADVVYQKAYDQALATVTEQVEDQADVLYAGYIDSIADSIYLSYIQSQSETIYEQVAAQAFVEQILALGYTQEQATLYLHMAQDKGMIADLVKEMTDEQKDQIITAAVANLTDEQKAQIKAGALASMNDDQKSQIRNRYIAQMMKSQEVTGQINAAVSGAVNSVAAGITELKGQLDNYSRFYEGLVKYTTAVSKAATGADTIRINMGTLYDNIGILNVAVGELNDAVKKVFDGTTELKNGTSEFVNELGGSEAKIGDVIDSIISSIAGSNVEIGSFVSAQNTNVETVQFVIKTEALTVAPTAVSAPKTEESLSFWQKLLRLFGLY